MRLHHVFIAIPDDGVDAARAFWVDGVGMTEADKPEPLATRAGAWFRSFDDTGAVTAEIHVGRDELFAPTRRAHPALVLEDERELDAVADRLTSDGYAVNHSERLTFPGYLRFHARDPFGNRVEFLAPLPGETPD